MKRKFILFFLSVCFFLANGVFLAAADDSLGRIVLSERDKPNLTGFIPLDHQPYYDIEVVPSSKEVLDAVLRDQDTIGFISPLEVLEVTQKNVPIIVLSSPYQFSPVAFAVKNNIFRRSYSDFVGKSVLYEPGAISGILFRNFLRQIQIDYHDLVWIPHDPKEHKSFENADIVVLDTLPEIVRFSRKLKTDFLLHPVDFGIDFKGPIMIASKDQMKNNSQRITALANQAFENLTDNIFNKRNIYSLFLQSSIPYIFQQDRQLGEITEQDWWQIQRIMLEEAQIDSPISVPEYEIEVADLSFKPSIPIQIALPGLPSADFSGFYIADDKGYYEKTKRQIEIVHYPAEKDVIQAVRSGEALIGVASPFSLIKAQSEQPDLKLLGVIYQENPTVFITLKESKTEKELISKNLLLGENAKGVFLSFIQPTPIKNGDIELEEVYPTPFALLDRRAQVVSGRGVFEDKRLKPYKDQFQIINHKEMNVAGYSIFTTVSNYRKNRDLIKNLLRFTYHGYENSVFQTREATQIVVEKDPSLFYSQVKAILEDNKNFLKDDNGNIGTIIPEKWEALAVAAFDKKFIDQLPDLTEFFPKDVKRKKDPEVLDVMNGEQEQ